jgi:hypothetical protein
MRQCLGIGSPIASCLRGTHVTDWLWQGAGMETPTFGKLAIPGVALMFLTPCPLAPASWVVRAFAVSGRHRRAQRGQKLAKKRRVDSACGSQLAVLSYADDWPFLRLLDGCIGYNYQPAHLAGNPHVLKDRSVQVPPVAGWRLGEKQRANSGCMRNEAGETYTLALSVGSCSWRSSHTAAFNHPCHHEQGRAESIGTRRIGERFFRKGCLAFSQVCLSSTQISEA